MCPARQLDISKDLRTLHVRAVMEGILHGIAAMAGLKAQVRPTALHLSPNDTYHLWPWKMTHEFR